MSTTTHSRAKTVKAKSIKRKSSNTKRHTVNKSILKRFLRVLEKILNKIEEDLKKPSLAKTSKIKNLMDIITRLVIIIGNLNN